MNFLFAATSPVPNQPKEENPLEQQQPTEPLQTSRSDSSLNGKFEMISESEVRESAIQQQQQQQMRKANVIGWLPLLLANNLEKNPATSWKKGYKWQRQLIFHTKLTMHTAYNRQDNSEPVSVTSLAISK